MGRPKRPGILQPTGYARILKIQEQRNAKLRIARKPKFGLPEKLKNAEKLNINDELLKSGNAGILKPGTLQY